VRSEIAMKLTEDPSLWEDLDNIFKPYLIKETLRRHQTSASSLRIIEGSLVLKLGLQEICNLVAWVTFHRWKRLLNVAPYEWVNLFLIL